MCYLVVKNLILRLHTSHKRVLSQIIISTAILLVGPLNLLLEGLNVGRKQTMKLECFALLLCKRRAFIELA